MAFNPVFPSPSKELKLKFSKGFFEALSTIGFSKSRKSMELLSTSVTLSSSKELTAAEIIPTKMKINKIEPNTKPNIEANKNLKN
jgi:hypothetical protein